jgi:hypothetical protein
MVGGLSALAYEVGSVFYWLYIDILWRCNFMVGLSTVISHWLDDSPAVTVSAPWLRDFGFEVGSKVVIEVSKGVISIKMLDSEEEL